MTFGNVMKMFHHSVIFSIRNVAFMFNSITIQNKMDDAFVLLKLMYYNCFHSKLYANNIHVYTRAGRYVKNILSIITLKYNRNIR